MLLRTLLLLLLPLSAYAQTSVSLTSVSGHPGDEVELSVTLQGGASVSACQISIPLPEALEYVAASAVLNTVNVGTAHQLSAGLSGDGSRTLNIIVHSIQLAELNSGEGELLRFRLKLGSESGSYQLQPAIVLSDSQGNALPCNSIAPATVTVLGYKAVLSTRSLDFGRVPVLGTYTRTFDVVNSGNEPLTVSGISCSSEVMSVTPQETTVAAGQSQTFTLTYAPVLAISENSTVTLAVGDTPTFLPPIQVKAQPFSVNELSVQGASGAAYQEVTIGVSLQNMEPIVAAQCCFDLPGALQFVEGSAALVSQRSVDHEIGATLVGQRLSFWVHSPTNTAFIGNSGQLFTFRLRLVSTGGVYPLIPQDVVLSNATATDMTSDVYGGEVQVAAPHVETDELIDFGRIPMEKPMTAVLTLHNTGDLPLTIERIVFSNPAFSILGEYPVETAPGASTDLTVLYQSAEPGPFEGSMLLYTNDPDHMLMAITMRGTAYMTNELTLSGRMLGNQHEQYRLSVGLKNSTPIVAMQFDVHWQLGMETAGESVTFTRRAANHQAVVTPLDAHTYRCYVYSVDNTPIAAGSGNVLSLLYNNVRATASPVGSTIRVDNVILSTASEQNCASAADAELVVTSWRGDANGDGVISIADVVAVVGFAMGLEPEGCSKAQADVDGDGQVDATDAVATTRLLMQEIYE